MEDFSWLSRTELLIGKENLIRLSKAHVLVIGLGGVGSFAAEFICRNGVGTMTIVDGDTVDPTNRNRQLPALATNHGQSKADIMAERLKSINPEVTLHVIKTFINPDAVAEILSGSNYDYIVDAIDSVTPKITFLKEAFHRKMRIVSSMGAGGRMDPTMLKVVDISKTYNCNFAQQIRKNLKKEGISKGIKAVFSTEEQLKESLVLTDGSNYKKSAYGTMSYLPAVFGATCASVVIRDLVGEAV
ncbi:tRNA threonylcarbamoyladenosine dehydratase [Dyadobacter psychrotolerans]|uniref:tRNA threonylcarbamoyladenosine dehydratase n=1 Tax=Dyadobacter psychrotolerans TaxID=2541721 RepID=A0A4R5DN35_9BACT|nr:tRNA threonylcarbamoyladenosine dehydratase [Dyadobacter psychrotolerans]TDE12113.1 tRNA threonylcarbamoyladenosine dehydratase [Dyadobacter psychrotolerans]